MKTTTVETSQLSGPALDWAVAKSVAKENVKIEQCRGADAPAFCVVLANGTHWTPSTDWSQGGSLIDDDYIVEMGEYMFNRDEPFYAEGPSREAETGETYLIAVCRVIVASALGDKVDVPSELAEASDA